MALHRFVFLVKNLRGVLAALPGEELEPIVSWLSRRFRYRDLGVPPSLYREARDAIEPRLGGRPFHLLGYPTARVEAAARRLSELLVGAGLPETVAEALLLASAYASPVLATPGAAEALKPIVVHVVYSRQLLDAQSARLHLRIVDYTVLDAYVETIDEFVRAVEEGWPPERLRASRLERAKRDEKRYWRVASREGTPLILYLDHASLALRDEGLAGLLAGDEERVLTPLQAAFNLGAVKAG